MKIISAQQRGKLNAARKTGRKIKVQAHERERVWYEGSEGQRLATWQQIEARFETLCRQIDRHGLLPCDRAIWKRLKALGEDSLEG